MTGSGPAGERRAKALARREAVQNALIGFAPTRTLIRRFVLPKPGQGPSKAARDAGFFGILFIGETSDGRSLRVSVKGNKDPGYGSTSKMIAESGISYDRDDWQLLRAVEDGLVRPIGAEPDGKVACRCWKPVASFSWPGDLFPR